MGVNPMFRNSQCRCQTCSSTEPQAPAIIKSQPNPKRFLINKVEQIGPWVVASVYYPEATNYEGNKVMVYMCSEQKLREQLILDPHFCQNKKHPTPFVRFEPTEQGWNAAIKLATCLSNAQARLDTILGKGVGAVKERKQLMAELTEAKKAEYESAKPAKKVKARNLQARLDLLNTPLLSQADRELLNLHYVQKIKQVELATRFGITQPAVNYRIKQAFCRLRFLETLPRVTEEELLKELPEALKDENGILDPNDVHLMLEMWRTPCQSKVARTLGLSASFFRHHFFRSVKRIEAKALEDSRFQPYATIYNTLSTKNFSVSKF